VAVDDALYVRAYHGQNSSWYQAALRQKAGRIIAAGLTKEVTFAPVAGPINDRIDEAYRAKYADSPMQSRGQTFRTSAHFAFFLHSEDHVDGLQCVMSARTGPAEK
jgi:hypothetical protein